LLFRSAPSNWSPNLFHTIGNIIFEPGYLPLEIRRNRSPWTSAKPESFRSKGYFRGAILTSADEASLWPELMINGTKAVENEAADPKGQLWWHGGAPSMQFGLDPGAPRINTPNDQPKAILECSSAEFMGR
jgi:hypothetical protein